MVTFEVAGGKAGGVQRHERVATDRHLEQPRRFQVAGHASGDDHPHAHRRAEERARLGITDGVIRLSVGLEDVADLKDDLAQALDALAARPRRAAE